MNARTTLALAVTALVLVPGLASALVAGSPHLTGEFTDASVSPGEETTLELVLVNEGDLEVGSRTNPTLDREVTTARGLTVELNASDAPLTVHTGTQALGQLPQGAAANVPYRIVVDEDARPGEYNVTVEVNYTHVESIDETTGERHQTDVSREFNVTTTVEEAARFDVVNVSSAARVGSTGTVALTVENTGSVTARDVTLSLSSTNAALSIDGARTASRHVETWAGGERRTVRYRVHTAPTADAATYPLTLESSYEDDGRTRTGPAETVAVTPAPEQSFSVVAVDSDVAVAGTGEVAVTLRNDGPVSVGDATVEFAAGTSALTFGGAAATSRHVGDWDAGETRTVTVDATAAPDAERRRYAVSASVTYDDTEGDAGAVEGLSFGVRPEPEQAFAVEDVSSTLRVGEEGKLSGVVRNTGDATVENVVVLWAGESRNVSPTETEAAVGTLAPGETAAFGFDVEVSDAGRAGQRQFELRVAYDNSEGDRRTGDRLAVQRRVAPPADEFEVEVLRGRVQAGGSGDIVLRVTNDRDQPLAEISAKLFADDPIATADDQAYVHRLGPGESTTLRFSVSASGGALQKQYPLSLDFQYDEPDGDTKVSDEYRVPVRVQTPDGSGLPGPVLVGGVLVVLLAIGGGAYYYRTR